MASQHQSGQLKRIYRDLRYGFIESKGKDYFFHKEDCLDDWHQICKDFETMGLIDLDFQPDLTNKGLRARNVRLTEH